MRTAAEIHKPERVHKLPSKTGNWMHLTIAPLVAEKLISEEPLPGAGEQTDRLGSVVGTTGRAGLAHDDPAESGE